MKNRLLPLVFVLGCYSAYSQVGIGTNNPHGAAQLEVLSGTKGILIPRVTLTDINDNTTIKRLDAGANSLLVYNLAGNLPEGYYYWTAIDGKWNRIVTSADLIASSSTIAEAGAPGTKGDIGEGVYIYTDTDTSIVYVKNADGTWTPINGKDGKDGVAGGTGIPGKDGVTAPADVTIWVNTEDGKIYVKDPISQEWISVSGKDGVDGAAGLAGGPGVPGKDGVSAPADTTVWINTENGKIYVKDPISQEWILVSAKDGVDGAAGLAGGPGVPGKDGVTAPADATVWVDTKDGTIYIKDPISNEWIPVSGKDGAAGAAGINGIPGKDAVVPDGIRMVVNEDGILYILKPGTDGTHEADWIAVNDNKGKGSLTSSDEDIISIVKADGITPGGTEILFADAVIKVKGGAHQGQVLTTKDATGTVGWSNPVNNKLSIKRVEGDTDVNVENDNVIIVDAGKMASGTLAIKLPAVTDENLIGKVFFIKRVDGNDNAIVTVASQGGGTIDDDGSTVTVGQNITFQIILESISPTVKWQTLSKF
ncbi:hypothetical protein [[Flexibacter] sp. ATCC 35103]|uniref:hypothetical protein n=1 Tax=[Flexibacter] sp. ATCC 35103 TaxID=1937528 RepID=UPI0009CA3026|nr:hypothetical protein [[Flexibacter] sp. ATCC 35103]OMQ10483.1 hypothetical protein BXU01_14500 [[Flexibacter] sp. ATCC 35103]